MDIIIKRGEVLELQDLPPYSIALDGAVQGPAIDNVEHRYSFDHHSGCYRYCTTAACMQAWTAILLGLEPENFDIYINDVDGDVCAAIWCLKNPDRCNEPRVSKLINAIGLLDMHCGAFPINGMNKTVEWICSPETLSKKDGDYYKLSDNGLKSLMESILHRIDLYVDGEAQIEVSKQQKHGDYKVLRNENGWLLAESYDPHAYSSIYQSGFDRVVLVRPNDDSFDIASNNVSIAKRSDFIDNFPLDKIFEALNKFEPGGGWGGSTSVGGAPRRPDGSRSKLSIEKITEVIDSVINNKEEIDDSILITETKVIEK